MNSFLVFLMLFLIFCSSNSQEIKRLNGNYSSRIYIDDIELPGMNFDFIVRYPYVFEMESTLVVSVLDTINLKVVELSPEDPRFIDTTVYILSNIQVDSAIVFDTNWDNPILIKKIGLNNKEGWHFSTKNPAIVNDLNGFVRNRDTIINAVIYEKWINSNKEDFGTISILERVILVNPKIQGSPISISRGIDAKFSGWPCQFDYYYQIDENNSLSPLKKMSQVIRYDRENDNDDNLLLDKYIKLSN